MSFFLNTIFSLSIGIAAIIGGVRFAKTDPAYHPFIILTWASFLNEIISFLVIKTGYSNAINTNLFLLLQSLLILAQFRKWELFRQQKSLFPIAVFCLSILWIWESFIYSTLLKFNSYFIIISSIAIILTAISMINRLIVSERNSLLKDARFLISFSIVVFFTFSVLVETFWLYGLNKSSLFRIRIYAILAYINLFCNLIYGVAILWMPMKLRYILLF